MPCSRQGRRCLSNSEEYSELNRLAVREAMLRLYPVLGRFLSDNGPEWAKRYYEEVKKHKIDAKEAVILGNVRLFPFPSSPKPNPNPLPPFPTCSASIALTGVLVGTTAPKIL